MFPGFYTEFWNKVGTFGSIRDSKIFKREGTVHDCKYVVLRLNLPIDTKLCIFNLKKDDLEN